MRGLKLCSHVITVDYMKLPIKLKKHAKHVKKLELFLLYWAKILFIMRTAKQALYIIFPELFLQRAVHTCMVHMQCFLIYSPYNHSIVFPTARVMNSWGAWILQALVSISGVSLVHMCRSLKIPEQEAFKKMC